MKKILVVSSFCLLAINAFAAGLDITFFGYKVCDFSFDVNPFSRDDGRSSKVYVPSCAPAYYTPPPPPARTVVAAAEPKSRNDERAIVIQDSSNVTIVNHENQQTNRPVYAPSVQTTYPTQYYYAAPTYYTYPRYYYSPCYYRPYCHYYW